MKIPKGWKRLRKGTVLKPGDKFSAGSNWLVTGEEGRIVGVTASEKFYIRKTK